jgi:hypothetical protein
VIRTTVLEITNPKGLEGIAEEAVVTDGIGRIWEECGLGSY